MKRNNRFYGLVFILLIFVLTTTIFTTTSNAATPTPSSTPIPTTCVLNVIYNTGTGGTVEITGPNPPPISIMGTNALTFPAGANISLYALSGDFRYWTVNGSNTSAREITVRMSGDRTVYVQFGGPTLTPTPTIRPTVTPTSTPTRVVTPTPTRVVTPTPTPVIIVEQYPVVSYVIQSDWGNGATVGVTIKNNAGTAINGWTLSWSFPGNQTITNLWNGTYTQNGASVSVRDAGFNASIPANGGTVNFGFNLNYSGMNAKPTSFTLNGAFCIIQ